VEDRASAFQGFGLAGELEPLKVLKYEVGGHYNHHHDSFPDKTARESMEGNRESTFFVFLEADCTGGGTNFPRLKPPEDERWCQYIDCDEPYDAGVTFKPITGNAVFWQNLYSNGSVHPDLIHAGLPVTSGLKIGLNVWTWTP
jgi:prolyl 4-hydroxylase